MPKIIVQQPFKFAHHGYQVEEFEPSETPRETSSECASVAVAEGWAVDADALQAQREAEQRAAAEQAAADAAATSDVQTSAQPAGKRAKKAHDDAPGAAAAE